MDTDREEILHLLRKTAPKVHCLTNPVSMQDVANILLTAGGSAIMGQDPKEASEITALCHATLLNTGVPDEQKFSACLLAGQKANALGHPVILDPVGAGASDFRRRGLDRLLEQVKISVIRCNQEEACTLLHMQGGASGGVESNVSVDIEEQADLAKRLSRACGCAVLLSGESDVAADGRDYRILTGGDRRMVRLTGSGCMLSALCALFAGTGIRSYPAACTAGQIWKESSRLAGRRTDREQGGMGSFRQYLFDALDGLCHGHLTSVEGDMEN